MLNIILANRWYPPYSGFGGVAAYQRDLGRELVNRGNSVTVLAARYSKRDPETQNDLNVAVYRELVRERGITARLPVLRARVRSLDQYIYSKRLNARLRELEVEGKISIVEFAEVNAEAYIYLNTGRTIPVIVRCHTPTFVLQKYYGKNEFPVDWEMTSNREKFCMYQADALSAPSRDMASLIESELHLTPGTIRVIPNALNVQEYSSIRASKEKRNSLVRILHVGRLDRTKGIEILMRAVPEVILYCQNVEFVFVGPDRPDHSGSTWMTRMTQYFKNTGVSAKVSFLGEIDHESILSEYAKADIAVIPSILYESFSYTCAQALAAGLPVVTSSIGGIPETVGDAALLVPPGDAGALAEALVHLVQDTALRSELAARTIDQCRLFDAPVVAEQMLRFYKEVAG
ncbi:MAG: glycosyltransferase family 4 protein [Bacteroidia bacterium]|nr:glycosyltransferase family 4 protein [Bacteroidia bacterium]